MAVERNALAICTRRNIDKKTYSLTIYANGEPIGPEIPFRCKARELGPPKLGQRYAVKFEVER